MNTCRRFVLSIFLVLTFISVGSFQTILSSRYPQIYFSPDDKVVNYLIDLIDKEEKSIQIAIYCLTHREVCQALIEAKNRGILVEVVVDPFSTKIKTPLPQLAQAKIPVFIWNPNQKIQKTGGAKFKKSKKSLMHDKFCIFGDEIVWTGSFNFTYMANSSNRENVVILKDKEIAKLFKQEFENIKNFGCTAYKKELFE